MVQRESTLQQRSRRDHTQRRRAEETPEQREARLLKDRERQGRRRAAETQEQREVRLQGRRKREQRGAETHHNYASVPSSSFALDLLCSHLVLSHLIHALRFDYVFLLGAQQRCNAHALTICYLPLRLAPHDAPSICLVVYDVLCLRYKPCTNHGSSCLFT